MSSKTIYRALSEEEKLDENVAFILTVVIYKDGRGEARCIGREGDCKVAIYSIKVALEMAQYIGEVIASELERAIEEESGEDSEKEDKKEKNEYRETSTRFSIQPCIYT
jgi:hypothetical protein